MKYKVVIKNFNQYGHGYYVVPAVLDCSCITYFDILIECIFMSKSADIAYGVCNTMNECYLEKTCR